MLAALLLSLRRVDTRLPVYTVLVGHVRGQPAYEGRLVRLGARIVRSEGFAVPQWASAQHAASFHKFTMLELPLEKVIYLDADCQVVRNIDHLWQVSTPAWVFHAADHGLNSGVMVLQPSRAAAAVARSLASSPRTGAKGDRGDQELWPRVYANETVFELPLAYNHRDGVLGMAARERCKVYVIHTADGVDNHASVGPEPDLRRADYRRDCDFDKAPSAV
jgi:hypothetical protein